MKTFLAFFLSLLLSATAFSDTYFSSQTNGLGTRQYITSVRALGMGGGFTFGDSLSVDNYSISQWRFLDNTRTTFLMGYNRITTDLPGTSFKVATAEFNGISIAIPIQAQKWVFGATFQPYLQKEFRLEETFTNPADSSQYTQRNETTGNINLARLNVVWSPMARLGLAVQGNFYFGTIEDTYTILFDANTYLDNAHGVQYQVRGAGFGFSADAQPVDRLHVAAFVDFKPKLDVDVSYLSSITYLGSKERNIDSFPMHYGVGGSVLLSKLWSAQGGFAYQEWSEVLKSPASNYDTWSRANFGIERRSDHKRRAKLWERFDWRAGMSQSSIGYLFNGSSVTEQALHMGFGMPFSNWNNRLDVAFTAGIRGDLTDNLAKENFFNVNVAISMGEKWFQKIR